MRIGMHALLFKYMLFASPVRTGCPPRRTNPSPPARSDARVQNIDVECGDAGRNSRSPAGWSLSPGFPPLRCYKSHSVPVPALIQRVLG